MLQGLWLLMRLLVVTLNSRLRKAWMMREICSGWVMVMWGIIRFKRCK